MSNLPTWHQPTIEAGAVVQLRSGGFSMTIEKVDGDEVHCVWADHGRVRREKFPVSVLKKSTEGTDLTIIMQGFGSDVADPPVPNA